MCALVIFKERLRFRIVETGACCWGGACLVWLNSSMQSDSLILPPTPIITQGPHFYWNTNTTRSQIWRASEHSLDYYSTAPRQGANQGITALLLLLLLWPIINLSDHSFFICSWTTLNENLIEECSKMLKHKEKKKKKTLGINILGIKSLRTHQTGPNCNER